MELQEAARIKDAHWEPEQQRELLLRVLEKVCDRPPH